MVDGKSYLRLSLLVVAAAACSGAPESVATTNGPASAADGGSPTASGASSNSPAAGSGAVQQPSGKAASSSAGAAATNRAGTAATAAASTSAAGSGAPDAGVRSPTAQAGTGGATQTAAAGSGGQSAGAAGNTAAGGDCSRELLQTSADAYFKALAAHDPQTLPLADTVEFTENGVKQELGKAGLWLTAGALVHAHYALDTEQCSVVGQAVVPDDGKPIPVALRLKLAQQKITEIETIAVRQGDYMLASNTDALTASAMTVHWEDEVPPDQRNTRAELAAWMDKYFRMFPRGVCNTVSDCKRIENGGGSFNCSAGASCANAQPGPSDKALEPRLILADVDRGIGIGFTMFQANTDMHMFKMYGGKVYGVSAILGKADSAGWP